jgi:hypothetical protein
MMATTQKPARVPRKPSRASEPAKGGNTARKPATGRRTAKTTGPTKPNPFDDIARQVIADQEAKDRETGQADLTPALAKPVDQAKAKRATTKPRTIKAKQQQAKARDKARPPTITLGYVWGDKRPDWLHRCTLVTRYEVRPDGSVWTTLHQVLGPDGKVLEDFWKLPLDFRTQQEVQGNGRKLNLKDRTIAGLQTWLIREGLTTPEDITTT